MVHQFKIVSALEWLIYFFLVILEFRLYCYPIQNINVFYKFDIQKLNAMRLKLSDYDLVWLVKIYIYFFLKYDVLFIQRFRNKPNYYISGAWSCSKMTSDMDLDPYHFSLSDPDFLEH